MSKFIAKFTVITFIFSLMFFSYFAESTTFITKLMVVGLFSISLLKLALPDGSFCDFSSEFGLLIIWLFFSILTGFFAVNFDVFYHKFFTILQVYIACFLLFNVIVWIGTPTIVWSGIYLSTIIISVKTLQNPAACSIGGRYVGTLGNSNLFALALLVSFVFALNRVFVVRNVFLKGVFLASTPCLVFMVAGTGSRKGILGVLLFLLLSILLRFRSTTRNSRLVGIATAMLFGVILVGVGAYFTTTEHFDRFEILYDAAKAGDVKRAGDSAYGRFRLYQAGLEMVAESPATGFGLDNFRVKLPEYFRLSGNTYAHSNFIEILVGTGIIGGLLYFSIYGVLAFKLFRMRNTAWESSYREQYLLAVFIFILFVIYDFAMVSYYEKLSWVILSGVISSVWLLEKERKRLQDHDEAGLEQDDSSPMVAQAGQ